MAESIDDVDPLLVSSHITTMEIEAVPEKRMSYPKRLLVETSREIWNDLKSTDWRKFGIRLLLFSWGTLIFLMAIFFPTLIVGTLADNNSYLWNYCAPDGSFSVVPVDVWNIQWFFQIVLGFGNLSFTTAKIIDVVWDVVGQTPDDFPKHELC